MIRLMLPADIATEWERISPVLEPAVEVDETRQMSDVYRDLMSGDFALFDVEHDGDKAIVVVEISQSSVNSKCLWLVYVAGHIGSYAPRAWIGHMRNWSQWFQDIARALNCTEIRIKGRDWSKVFPDWECVDPDWHELRKELV